ncbi:MAG: hypothetical protein HQK81_13005 [Desulfovibrionaceae bacterium]|nr:hypothetical protein [Desulfovibrionaceae bacterium]MBF0514963.1 hypothetical protein [Desulfovibrionaceae bacterium]
MADPVAIFRVRQTPLRELLPRFCLDVAPAHAQAATPAAAACLPRPASAARVRELLDSMYLGYPIAHVAVVKTPPCCASLPPGALSPALTVLDGADMLAGLAEAMLGRARAGGARVVVAFRPDSETFFVNGGDRPDRPDRREGGNRGNGGNGPNGARRGHDPECIPDIAQFFCAGVSRFRLVTDFLDRLAAAGPLDEERKETISRRIDRLLGLAGYPVTVFEFAAGAPRRQVLEAVLRLRSKGLRLTSEDVALAETGCRRPGLVEDLFRFCRAGRRPPEKSEPSPFKHLLRPSPRDMVMAALAGPSPARTARLRTAAARGSATTWAGRWIWSPGMDS